MGSMGYKVTGTEYAHQLITERAIDEPRSLRVIYVGAGVSGICAAIQFPKFVPNLELAIYEKNADVGGTWFENKYPGCACDIPAHSYQLSYESEVNWSKFYVGAPEILEYWRKVVKKHNIRPLMKFGHECTEARWNEKTCKWHVKFRVLGAGSDNVVEDVADVFMTGIGALNAWKWPDIEGLHTFKGKLLHSANWDPDYDPTGHKIAVIGGGSSGIQIVPTLQPKVKGMDHYIRGRTWIAASFGSQLVRERNDGKDGNFEYTPEEIERWKQNPESYVQYRKTLEIGMQGNFAMTHRGTPEQQSARAAYTTDMRKRLAKKSHIADRLIPEFDPLCKRLTPGPGYLEALVADNVNVIWERISHIDATGITTVDGIHRPVDTIITATGFDTSFQGRFPIYGRGGVNLQERNKLRTETYLGVAVDQFPNFFHSLGPNSGLGNGNLLLVIESIANYLGQVLEKLSKGNIKTIEPKRKPVEDFTNYCDEFFKRTVFSAACGSWYLKHGRITALWPGSSIHAARALEKVRFEDYEMTTVDGNEFGWFGDGWAVAERTGDVEGLSWYLNNTNFLHESLELETHLHVENGEALVGDNINKNESDPKKRDVMTEYKVPNGALVAAEI
ncbi:hypothetical protein CLAIMM_07111 [Cladophialophora immunda]|nr:hypothetical protein CLAIMM_07111 [Cladophialophora immunda]